MINHHHTILVHFHIFKNAGSTIDWVLRKNFSEQARFFDGNDPEGTLSASDLINYLIQHPNTKSISSHQLRFPLPVDFNAHFVPLIFLRNPIDRALSIYNYYKRIQNDYVFTIKAHNLSFKEFLLWYFSSGNVVMKNFQVLFLSRSDNLHNATISDFPIAVERLKQCPIVGIVERMEESLVLAEEFLHSFFEDIDLSYVKQNVDPHRIEDQQERCRFIEKQIGSKISYLFNTHNALDLKLYDIANDLLDYRLRKVEDLQQKITNFKNRCKELHCSKQ